MDKQTTKSPVTLLSENGIYVQGVVISNSARKITKKDGSILAVVRHELALQPGVAVLEEFLDPRKDPEVKVEGDEVVKFPQIKEFETVLVKGSRLRDNNGQITIGSWQIIDRA